MFVSLEVPKFPVSSFFFVNLEASRNILGAKIHKSVVVALSIMAIMRELAWKTAPNLIVAK